MYSNSDYLNQFMCVINVLFPELMEEANLPYAKRAKLSEPMVKYCTHLMDKYGEDYKVSK